MPRYLLGLRCHSPLTFWLTQKTTSELSILEMGSLRLSRLSRHTISAEIARLSMCPLLGICLDTYVTIGVDCPVSPCPSGWNVIESNVGCLRLPSYNVFMEAHEDVTVNGEMGRSNESLTSQVSNDNCET